MPPAVKTADGFPDFRGAQERVRSPELDRDGPRDECGVFGVYAPQHDVSRLAYFALYALQHRGQESAGITTCESGHMTTQRDLGLVSQVFDERSLRALTGDMAIGHVRYSTTGGRWRLHTTATSSTRSSSTTSSTPRACASARHPTPRSSRR